MPAESVFAEAEGLWVLEVPAAESLWSQLACVHQREGEQGALLAWSLVLSRWPSLRGDLVLQLLHRHPCSVSADCRLFPLMLSGPSGWGSRPTALL